MKTNDNISATGMIRFTKVNKLTGEKTTGEWIKNKIVSSTNHGLNLVCQHLNGVITYPLEITQAKIGTGSTPTALGNTDLETSVLDGILKASSVVANNQITFEFFISDGDLANGTYSEFGLFCGNQMFSRVIISPAYTKSSNEDTVIEYSIQFQSI
jgi:hypothetical protein